MDAVFEELSKKKELREYAELLYRQPEQLLHFAQESRQSGRRQVQRKAARFLRRCAE